VAWLSGSRQRGSRRCLALPVALALTALAATTSVAAGVSRPKIGAGANRGLLRVDQVGYLPGDTKIAYLMASGPLSGERYRVVNAAGATVASGAVTAHSRGSWNMAYPDVYPIDFSAVSSPAIYHVVVSGPVAASSDRFRVESAPSLYGPLINDGVNFFQNQRDGADVIRGRLRRQPSHRNDASATVYADPIFEPGGSDVIKGNLKKIGGPVDVEGGWFDAGDYLKFTFTASYADDLLYAAARALGRQAPASLSAEAQHGTQWLNEMWNRSSKTLYLQVGIGSGNETTFYGDHDLWRLPRADDSDTNAMDYFAAAHRPVFEAAAPGARIDPDIVGRVAAAFAFAAQADARATPSLAATELAGATSLYQMANTHPSSHLGSTLPPSYYPESIWHDAMELAATEIVLAQQDLGDPSSTYMPYLRQAAAWASDYITSDSGKDTLNLYDVSALAHADLITAIKNAGSPAGLAVSPAQLIANLRAQLAAAARTASSDIFHEGGDYTNFDVDSHTFGLISTEALYERASGDREYAAFAGKQRDWLFGANPWGVSFMVGVGTTFPDCMQSQIPNLAGSLNAKPPIDTGAVVNGPNATANFNGGLGGLQSGMMRCEHDSGRAFTGHGSEYLDDVRAWQTDEPALDMTGSAILAAALQR
jgi:endoglucanase